jgi:hypothetical protein
MRMSEILFHYHKVNPTTWVYLSSLLMMGLYFKFGRFWSVRNLDLVLLILLAPGLLIAQYGGEARVKAARLAVLEAQEAAREAEAAANERAWEAGASDAALFLEGTEAALLPEVEELAGGAAAETQPLPAPEDSAAGAAPEAAASQAALTPARSLLEKSRQIERWGFLWLFAIGAVWLVRLLVDPTMVRRPLLEPNLTTGGLIFFLVAAVIFLMANVWTSKRLEADPFDVEAVADLAAGRGEVDSTGGVIRRGPGYALLNPIPSISTMPLLPEGVAASPGQRTYTIVAKLIVTMCHLAVVLGIAAIGYWHFGSTKTGVGVAVLYLILPYTAQMTGYIDHVIPAALLVWAVLCYRRPLTAGMFLGLATSLVYYPGFLLPLWISFYWRRGLMRFVIGVVVTLVLMAVALVFIPNTSYWENLKQMFGLWLPIQEGLEGIWGLGWNPVYRLPVITAFCALCCTMAIWPAQKNLGTLLSCSAAVMVATQFWHGYGGGLYMGWYLPLTLLTIFRPNLEDRVALAVLGEGWKRRRVGKVADGFKAA